MIRIYFGKSAAGKDYYLKQDVQNGFKRIISYTTRPMRPQEVEGVDYYFITKEEFKKKIANDEILEYRTYEVINNGEPDVWYYGSPKVDATSTNYVCILDIQGVKTYLSKYNKDLLQLCYVYVTRDSIRKTRYMNRGNAEEAEWERRYIDDERVFSDENIAEVEELYGRNILRICNNG